VDGITVTGTVQHEAWRDRRLPPVEEVRPGLWSIPVPILDSPMRYTLSYAFVGTTAVVVVDPGWDTADGREALTAGLAAAGADLRDVSGVVVTHIHPDHHGLSGWLREISGAWIAMHPAEAETLPARAWRERSAEADAAWLRQHGVPDGELVIDYAQLAHVLAMAEPDRYLNDGDRLPITDHNVRAVWTPGHTPGHLCLHDESAGVLLTGDHLLPRISPNIGVHSARQDDPLSAYLASLDRTAAFATDEALPAHEYRFRGIDRRVAALKDHHEERGKEVLAAVDRLPHPTTWAIAAELTWSRGWPALHGFMRRMALAETVAHLRHLVSTGTLAEPTGTPLLWRRRRSLPPSTSPPLPSSI
jgi:glyoxylase-like metal-dependent hydrolase (beta-lactamase superfamily II)